MTASTPSNPSDQTRAFADFAFGSQTHVADASRPLAWLSPEELNIDLSDPVQRRFGDYELIERIGQGGMGVVYRARQHGLERDVAIKLLAAGPWASEEFVARFRREARSAARMQHPNIVEIYEFGHRDGLNYFSMRLIEGPSLAQRLAKSGPMPVKEAAKLLRTLAEAMDYAHRLGVLHLDLKPANVLIGQNGEPLIADFGLARRIDAGHEGGNEEISGTPSYMAPEQALLKSHPLTASTDIYGLGAILYETLTGRPPFQAADAQATLERVIADAPKAPRALRKDISPDLEAICLKCLEKEPEQRYASARELADDLNRFLEGNPVSVRALNPFQRLRRWAHRKPAEAALLVVLTGGLVTTTQQMQEANEARAASESSSLAAQKAEQVAKSERDSAQIASEIGAYLYAHGGDAKNNEDRASGLIAWLRKRLPGDEQRQADALSTFATSVSNERRSDAEDLLFTIVKVLGVDYRRQVTKALLASPDKYRHVYSAMLAWDDDRGSNTSDQFNSSLQTAIKDRPDDPFVWQVAAVFCPVINKDTRCLYPQAAETLVRIAPDNMYHWLLLSMASTDPSRRREALHEAAKRTQFDDYMASDYLAYAKAIDVAAVPVPPLIARPVRVLAPNERPESSIALLEAESSIPLANWGPLVRYCGVAVASVETPDPETRADCLTVGLRLARSNGGLVSRMIGVALVRNLAKGTPLAEEAGQVRRLYTYLGSMDEKLSPRQRMSYSTARYLADISSAGEMTALQRRVESFGMPGQPPADWKPDDPNVLLSSRERVDNLISINNAASLLLAQGKYAKAVDLLAPIEAGTRKYFTDRNAWRVPRFLMNLGKARAALGQYTAAEANLLEAWSIVQTYGPTSKDLDEYAQAIAALYVAWNAAEPGKGYDAKALEWKQTAKGI